MSRSLAVAWGKDNIQVNCILPGFFRSEMSAQGRKANPGVEEMVTGRIPAGRSADPIDMAGTAVFLASAASNYVSGVAIPVDGGYAVQG